MRNIVDREVEKERRKEGRKDWKEVEGDCVGRKAEER